jgi:tetratricopeptide (TPR) repeat protein
MGQREFLEKREALLRFKSERGVGGLDLLASAVLREGERALAEGKTGRASELGALARDLCPNLPTPHFFLARVIASDDQNRIVGISQEYLAGWLEALKHFWFLFFFVQSATYLAMIAFVATALALILFTVFFYCPLWLHEWRERTGGLLREWALFPLVLWILLVPPVWSQGVFWGPFVCTILLWSFYSSRERFLVGAFILLVALSFFFLPYIVSFRAAKSSELLNLMVRDQRGEGSTHLPDSDRLVAEDPGSWVPYYTLAGLQMDRGDYAAALSLYRKALEINPGSPLILNNIGNAHFYLKAYDRAVESYKAASRSDSKWIEPIYNLSRVYQEKLLFEEAQERYAEAQRFDEKRAELYTRITAENPAHPVIQGRLGMLDLWRKAIDPERGKDQSTVIWSVLFGPLSIKASPVLAVIWAGALFARSGLKRARRHAIRCESCRRVICHRCQKIIFDFKVCGPCWDTLKTIRKRAEVLPHLRGTGQNNLVGLAFALVPGGGYLYHRETIKGALLLCAFFLVVGYGLLGGIFHPNLMWRMSEQKEIWVSVGLGLLYLLSLLDVWRTHSRRGV